MSAADDFLSLFDEQGQYKNGDGDVGVVFLTQSGSKYPGKLRFKSGLLVSARWRVSARGVTRTNRRLTA